MKIRLISPNYKQEEDTIIEVPKGFSICLEQTNMDYYFTDQITEGEKNKIYIMPDVSKCPPKVRKAWETWMNNKHIQMEEPPYENL